MKMTVNPAVTETKVVEISPATYTLELDKKEMIVLASFIGNTNGSPAESEFRQIVDKLWSGGFNRFIDQISYLGGITAPKDKIKV